MPSRSHPNILFVCFDSLSALDSALNHDKTAVPALNTLFDNSIRFSHTYTPSPESSPARASLFTGLDPCVHGLWTNGVMLPSHRQTFADILSQAGYANWLFGRWQMAGVSNWTTEPIHHGSFKHIEWAHGPLHRSRQNAYLLWLQQTAPDVYDEIFASQANPDDTNISKEQHKAVTELPDDLSFNYWICQSVRQRINTQPPEHPFLAVAAMVVGSTMGSEPQTDGDCESLNRRALQQADKALAIILDDLANGDQAQDTIIIVTAARGTVESADDAMCEQAIRVPLLIHHNDFDAQIIHSPVSTIDIAPTVLEVAGLPVPQSMQGTSLLRVLDGSTSPRGWALSRQRTTVGQKRHWKSALRAKNLKLVVSHGNVEAGVAASYQLFDLYDDPAEQQNLADNVNRSTELESMIDLILDARCALENRTEPRIAKF